MSPFLPCRQLSDFPRNDSRRSRFSIKQKRQRMWRKSFFSISRSSSCLLISSLSHNSSTSSSLKLTVFHSSRLGCLLGRLSLRLTIAFSWRFRRFFVFWEFFRAAATFFGTFITVFIRLSARAPDFTAAVAFDFVVLARTFRTGGG